MSGAFYKTMSLLVSFANSALAEINRYYWLRQRAHYRVLRRKRGRR